MNNKNNSKEREFSFGNDIFFNNCEGEKHRRAKYDLLNILIEGSITIKDNLGNTYTILNKKEGEFLHLESFLINYDALPTYSSTELPCKKHLNFNLKDHRLMCNQKGNFGVVEVLPCRKCIELNYCVENFQEIKRLVGFTPDISYGYNNQHIIWFEIKNHSGCSDYKKKFCCINNITLLEINHENIDRYAKELIFENLSHQPSQEEMLNKTISNMCFEIEQNRYAPKSIYKNELKSIYADLSSKNFNKKYQDILNQNDLCEITQRNKSMNIKFGMPMGNSHLIVKKDFLNNINIFNLQYENELKNTLEDQIEKIKSQILESISKEGYTLSKNFKKDFLIILGKLNKKNTHSQWKKFLSQNKLKELERYDKNKYNVKSSQFPYIIIKK